MNIDPIYLKEWLKLKHYVMAITALAVIIGSYFWFGLGAEYANIEPESMMWYRFSHLADKPYGWLMYCFILTGAIVATCQFTPEVMGKKVRILTHLPVSLNRIVLKHLLSGILVILLVNGILALIIMLAFKTFYPTDILWVALRDMLFGQLPAMAAYLGLAAVIIEKNRLLRVFKFIIAALATFVLLKERYGFTDVLGAVVIAWLILPVKDSFLSVKTRRLESRLFMLSVPVIVGILVWQAGTRLYNEYTVDHNKYYIFYSPLLEKFVYQENAAHHNFFYGTQDEALDKSGFEESLPFVYWRNLDIQGKLPVTINGTSYSRNEIRNSRMSLEYNPSRVNKPEVELYPFFNPISHLGSIPFPESAFVLRSDGFKVYMSETAKPDIELSNEVGALAEQRKVAFPIQAVWGKTTNMKPFDWGYFIKDNSGNIFNLSRADDVVHLTPVGVSDDIGEIVYIQVSENRHKQFYGYAISEQSKVYLISYPDYQFIPLDLDGFDYRTMKFQFLADPLYYVMRFDDGETYSAVRFDKEYTRLDSVELL